MGKVTAQASEDCGESGWVFVTALSGRQLLGENDLRTAEYCTTLHLEEVEEEDVSNACDYTGLSGWIMHPKGDTPDFLKRYQPHLIGGTCAGCRRCEASYMSQAKRYVCLICNQINSATEYTVFTTSYILSVQGILGPRHPCYLRLVST